MTKSWNIDTLLPEAIRTYQSIERYFGIKVYYPMPVRRYCQNAEDVKRCGRRIRNPRYLGVVGNYCKAGAGPSAIRDTHGSFQILKAGYVDLPVLIQALQKHFIAEGKLQDEQFNYSTLQANAGNWCYKNLKAKRVVFCEGTGVTRNPWFQHLPLTPAKGETLILSSASLKLPPSIYHSTKWLLPYEAKRFRVGATYDESDLDPTPTAAGQAELLSNTKAILSEDHTLQVEAHMAGLRPSTQDARPFLGRHPDASGLFILNGLGSKGASVGPEMSRQLINHIFDNEALDHEVDIARYT